MAINPFRIGELQLPPNPQQRPIDFSGLERGLSAGVEGFQREKLQQLVGALTVTDDKGAIDEAATAANLARHGVLQPSELLAAGYRRQQLAQTAAAQRAQEAYQTESLNLRRQELEKDRLQPGFRSTAAGEHEFIKGSVADPAYIRDVTAAKTPTGSIYDAETLAALARQARTGDTSVFTNVGRGAQGAENILALRREIARQNAEAGVSPEQQAAKNAEYFGEKAGQRTLGTRAANIELPAAEFQQMAPLALEASSKVDRTRFPNLNAIANAIAKGTGDENIVRFNAANNTLVNVYSRAVSPTGVPTDALRQHAYDLLNTGYSKGQYSAVVDMMNQEIAAARRAPGSVREHMRESFTGQPGQQQQQSPVRVSSPEEARKLPKGTRIMLPDGSVGRVP